MSRDELLAELSTLSEREIVALTIYGEARGEPVEGQIAVGCVIRNRVRDKRWPDDFRGVCLQPSQFSCWNEGDPTQAAVLRAARKAQIGQHDPVMRQCLWVALGVCDDSVQDTVRGANHYFADSIAPPSWSERMILVAKRGHHTFFRAT